MKLINRDTDYAIRALCHIAKRKNDITSAQSLVRCLKIPRPFLRKILQNLNKKGFLKSYRGKGGGFFLARPPEKIFILDLIKLFQGPFNLSEHILRKVTCPHIKKCVLKKKLDAIQLYISKELKSVTIASLMKGFSQSRE